MPYKHIAAQLKKTELACRLHYHQLSFGSKSRRNAASTPRSANDRSSMSPPDHISKPIPQLPLPTFSPPASPDNQDYRVRPMQPDASAIPKPQLPKPDRSPERSTQDVRQLKLVTENVDTFHERQYVDLARLDRIYESHRLHFWSTIARSYGCNLSPSILEDAWRRSHGMTGSHFPPTPRGSPLSSQPAPSILTTPFSAMPDTGRGFTPVNLHPPRAESLPPRASQSTPTLTSRKDSCAISALLTEDREVRRSPAVEKRTEEVEMRAS